MIYLTRMLGKPVLDAAREEIGTIQDIAIVTGEIFPRVTSLAFRGPDKTPFMLSWRKFVDSFDSDGIVLSVPKAELRFSYQQPDEVLLHRDLLNKQIVDTQGMKVVRVNDLKLSESRNQLRLLGAEVGTRGILRGLSPALENLVVGISRVLGRELGEKIIAWNYMDLLERDLSSVKLSVTHKRLHELHPADVADILEQLSPAQRAAVFEHLDNTQAAEAISELQDDLQAEVIDDLGSERASDILEIMDPDDAADIVGDLPYHKAETLLRLMGVRESSQVRKLLGYREKTAGGIMTPQVTTVTEDMTVAQVLQHLRTEAAENESIYYIYVVDSTRMLSGVVSLRDLIVSEPDTTIAALVYRDCFTVGPDDDQEQVAETMSKYDLLALPVVDEDGRLLGMVTVDDALRVMEEEADEDLALATGLSARAREAVGPWRWISRDGWLPIWAAALLLGAVSTRSMGVDGALAFAAVLASPMVLRVAEDVASHVAARVIGAESDELRGSTWSRVIMDGLVGLALGIATGLVWFGVTVLSAPTSAGRAVVTGALTIAVPFAVTIVALTLAATPAAWIARRWNDRGTRVSQVALSIVLMLAGEGVFLALFMLGQRLLVSMVSGR